MLNTAAGRERPSASSIFSVPSASCPSVRTPRARPTRFSPPISIHSMGKPAAGTSRASRPCRRPHKKRLVTAPLQFPRHRQRGNDVPSGTPASHEEPHPDCSLTLSSMPSETIVLSSELPP